MSYLIDVTIGILLLKREVKLRLKTELSFIEAGNTKPTIRLYYGWLGLLDGLIDRRLYKNNPKSFSQVKFKVRPEIVVDSNNKV